MQRSIKPGLGLTGLTTQMRSNIVCGSNPCQGCIFFYRISVRHSTNQLRQLNVSQRYGITCSLLHILPPNFPGDVRTHLCTRSQHTFIVPVACLLYSIVGHSNPWTLLKCVRRRGCGFIQHLIIVDRRVAGWIKRLTYEQDYQ